MNLLSVDSISKQFSERLLFDGASMRINAGDRIGLIGVNGSGKSTLLKIVAGIEAPDAGSVRRWGNVRVEYLAQDPALDDSLTVLETIFYSDSPQMQLLRAYEEATAPDSTVPNERLLALSAELDRTGGWAAEANAKAILTKLDIARFDAKVGTLSGGQRKRVALARALIDRADLLVLDEPTNHLDADTVAWLEEYLSSATAPDSPDALLMVTHDRYFLDRVVNRIVELDRRQLVSYEGNYSRYLEGREARHERLAAAEQKRQQLLKRELEWVRRAPTARGTKQKARKQRVEELMTIEYDSGDQRVSMALASARLGKQVLDVRHLRKSFGDAPDEFVAVDDVSFRLEPGDRLGIIGPNGAGKSTFLNLLAGQSEPDGGTIEWGETVRLGYYDQRSIDLDDSMRLIEFVENEAAVVRAQVDRPHWLSAGDKFETVEAPQLLEWFLFPRPMQYGRIGSLSGGERRRLYLLRTLIRQPNVLFLDEPTNDLDVQTLGVLEEFLDHFAGCLVVVSHDRYFLDRTVDQIASYEDGTLGRRYPSPYEAFKRLYEQEQNQERESKSASDEATPDADFAGPAQQRRNGSGSSSKPKLTWKEQRELETLEAQIATLETRTDTLNADMASAGSDYERLQTLSAEADEVTTELDEAMMRWLELEEKRGVV